MAFDQTWQPDEVHDVLSDSSDKSYTVWLRKDGKHQCECTGFATKRNKFGGYSAIGNPQAFCKHITRLLHRVNSITAPIDPAVVAAAKERALKLRAQLA